MAPHPIMKVKGTDCTERYSLRSQSQFENQLRNDVWNIGEIATAVCALPRNDRIHDKRRIELPIRRLVYFDGLPDGGNMQMHGAGCTRNSLHLGPQPGRIIFPKGHMHQHHMLCQLAGHTPGRV